MGDRELTRLRVMVDLADGRLTVDAAAALMRIGRRQVDRLRSAFAANGPAALASRKRGRPSNRKHGDAFRRTALTLLREDTATSARPWRRRSWASVTVLGSALRRCGSG